MKRRPEDEPSGVSPDSKVESLLGHFFQKHPRFLLYCTIGLGILCLLVIILVKVSAATD